MSGRAAEPPRECEVGGEIAPVLRLPRTGKRIDRVGAGSRQHDRIGLDQDYSDLRGCWVKRGDEIVKNAPRLLINDLDALPLPDFSPEGKHYLGAAEWVDTRKWETDLLAYDIMMVRGCPFECTFCIHNYTRKVTVGLGKYIRRRSVDHRAGGRLGAERRRRAHAAVASGRKRHVARTTGKSPETRKWIQPGVVSLPSQPGAER